MDHTTYIPTTDMTGDIVHRFYHEQLQIDDNPVLALSYVDGPKGHRLNSSLLFLPHLLNKSLNVAVELEGNDLNANHLAVVQEWGGTCAFPFRTATSRSCSPSGACAPITSPSGGGSSALPGNGTTFASATQTNQRQLAGG
jgi:hypothetical protein